jgi:hypothetical protein
MLYRMAKGICITITRIVETREPIPGERWQKIWTGTAWRSLFRPPNSPKLAKHFGDAPRVATTRIEFPPAGTITMDALHYRRTLFQNLKNAGILR